MMYKKRTYPLLLSVFGACVALIVFSFLPNENTGEQVTVNDGRYSILNTGNTFTAGDAIRLAYQGPGSTAGIASNGDPEKVVLWVDGSYGSVALTPSHDSDRPSFNLPDFLCQTAGDLKVTLLVNHQVMDHQILQILPKENSKVSMESYFGPPSIRAGTNDFAMLVTLPTDAYDNLLADSTRVTITSTFKGETTANETPLENGYGWKIYPSTTVTGKYFLNASLDGVGGREMECEVRPSLASDFNISAEREHPYADGNQVAVFTTSVIRDRYGNIVSDGTLVSFELTEGSLPTARTAAATINGVARAEILHPDHPLSWTIHARIPGMAKSDSLQLDFKPITDSLLTKYLVQEDRIVVGPLKSYMGQWVPDGTEVALFLDGTLLLVKESKDGSASFPLSQITLPKGNLELEVRALGLVERIVITR